MYRLHAGDMVISLDGNLLVHPDDFLKFLKNDYECVGGCTPTTDDPVYLHTKTIQGVPYTTAFSRVSGEFEWTGFT